MRTVAKADKIVVLEEGTVAEEGNHDQLLSQEGPYVKMWHIQQESLGWSI
jgi:ATP-binding cassette, subfamily B, bacterial IrtB/YbtQ